MKRTDHEKDRFLGTGHFDAELVSADKLENQRCI